jgi:hypothetical protein
VAGRRERRDVTDLDAYPCGGPDPDAGHRGQDRCERERIKDLLYLDGDLFALPVHQAKRPGQVRQDGRGRRRAGNDDGLSVQRGFHSFDQPPGHPWGEGLGGDRSCSAVAARNPSGPPY